MGQLPMDGPHSLYKPAYIYAYSTNGLMGCLVEAGTKAGRALDCLHSKRFSACIYGNAGLYPVITFQGMVHMKCVEKYGNLQSHYTPI